MQFSQVAAGHFGSGWAWLVQDPKDLSLQIKGTHDAANPMTGTHFQQSRYPERPFQD